MAVKRIIALKKMHQLRYIDIHIVIHMAEPTLARTESKIRAITNHSEGKGRGGGGGGGE